MEEHDDTQEGCDRGETSDGEIAEQIKRIQIGIAEILIADMIGAGASEDSIEVMIRWVEALENNNSKVGDQNQLLIMGISRPTIKA